MIIVELVNDQLNLEDKNTKIHFHLICLSILIIGITYVYFKIAIGEVMSEFGSYSSLLG